MVVALHFRTSVDRKYSFQQAIRFPRNVRVEGQKKLFNHSPGSAILSTWLQVLDISRLTRP